MQYVPKGPLIGAVGLLVGMYAAQAATPAVEVSQTPETGAIIKDCDVCPEMVVIPPGWFRMGDLNGGGLDWELPVHDVRIDYYFAAGRYEVTFAEWEACVSDGGCGRHRPIARDWGRGNRPVIDVSWDDARNYAAWLSTKTGQEYRLLSESEWEYAARAGATTQYSWGNSIGSGNANCYGCDDKWDADKPSPVGSFRPNAFGLYDVHGNVWEWVEDCWHENYNGAPDDGSPWTLKGECRRHVMRGGSWVSGAINHRAAARSRDGTDYRLVVNGFRVARTLSR